MVASLTGAEVAYVPNPRKDSAENDHEVQNDQFLALGLTPITLETGLLSEVVDVAKAFAHRIDRTRVPAVSAWTKDIASRVEHNPEGTALRSVS
jgi:UDP-sulfoquinovose synthase